MNFNSAFSFNRHPELVSGSISPIRPARVASSDPTAASFPSCPFACDEPWTLKQVQGDEIGRIWECGSSSVTYTVKGIGAGNAPLIYAKDSLADAGYLASKMKDSGVADVSIVDAAGEKVSITSALKAFENQSRRKSSSRTS